MKALLITNDFPPIMTGGLARYYYNLCRYITSGKICVLAPSNSQTNEFDRQQKFEIYRYPVPTNPALICRLCQIALFFIFSLFIVRRRKIQLILCAHLYLSFIGWLIKKLLNRPYFVFLVGGELTGLPKLRLVRRLFVAILNEASRLVVVSEFVKMQYLKLGIKNRNFVKISPGVQADEFGFPTNPLFEQNKKIILSVGRLIERKGFDIMIEALPKVLSKVPNALYLIVGQGPFEKQLKELVKERGLEKEVVFVGSVEDHELPKYYHACHLFVMLSREMRAGADVEGFGIVYLEANACGKPVIGGRSGGVPEAVVDGVTGLLVDPLDVNEVAAAVIKLLTEEEYAKQLGENGKRRVEEDFNWESRARELERLINAASGKNYVENGSSLCHSKRVV